MSETFTRRSAQDVRRGKALAVAAVHLTVLWSIAVAQPLLDLLGDAPEFFVARENTRGDILLLAVGVTLIPPLVLTAVEALAALASPVAGRIVHLVLVCLLAGAFALQVLEGVAGGSAAVLIPLAVVLGLAAAAAYARTRFVRALLTTLAPAPLVFVFVFLVLSPVSKLVFPRDSADAADVSVRGATPVVMIVFDELSAISLMGADRRIDATRFPGVARLARDATWYRNATTVADFTERAVPALLTGEMPERGSLPIASDHPESLFTLLGRDYSFDVIEPITDVCPARLCPEAGRPATHRRLRSLVSDLSIVSLHLLAPDDLRRRLPPVDRAFDDFGARAAADGQAALGAPPETVPERVPRFRALGDRLRRPAGAHLSFQHVDLPHQPFEFLPSGQRYDARGYPSGLGDAGVWTKNRSVVREGQRRHLLQAAFADRLLGRALANLRRSGVYDRALIVVAADHGVAFRPGVAFRAAADENLPEIASIPLLVKAPGQREERIDDTNVRSIDVLPTIAERLGVRLPWKTDGHPAGSRTPPATVTLHPFYGEDVLTIAFDEFVRRRDALAARTAAEFAGDGAESVFRGGPHADLVGERVVALRAPKAAGARLELTDTLASVDPSAPVVPALLSGRVFGAPGADHVALALNGTVAAVTAVVQEGGVGTFQAMVPPAAFANGANRVSGFAVSGLGGRRRLVRLEDDAALGGFRLVEREGRQVIVDGAGEEIAVEPGIEGFVEGDPVKDGVAGSLHGWAADIDRLRPASLVIAFAGDRLLAVGRPSTPRPDLAKKYGFALASAGFRLDGLAVSAQPDAPLKVFGVVDGRASPLQLTKP